MEINNAPFHAKNRDIYRFSGDTYPEQIIYEMSGAPVNLNLKIDGKTEQWKCTMRIKKIDDPNAAEASKIIVIKGILTNPNSGAALFYPNGVEEGEELLGFEDHNDDGANKNTLFDSAIDEAYNYSLIREFDFDSPDPDADEKYTEKMTHEYGVIYVKARV